MNGWAMDERLGYGWTAGLWKPLPRNFVLINSISRNFGFG